MLSGAAHVPDKPVARRPGQAPPYLPFGAGPPDFGPNLKPISVASWLAPDTEADAWLPAKRTLLREAGDRVAAGDLDGAEAVEVAALIRRELPHLSFPDQGPALMRAAWAVSDDLCLLQARRPGDWRLIAGVVCAATYWSIGERIGMDLGALHGPVPGGDPVLARRIGRVFSGLRPGRVLQRLNWTIQAGGAHHTPDRPVLGPGAASELFLRVERQTLRALPETGAVVFTIRICLDPLQPLLGSRRLREQFEDAWLGAAGPVRTYKAWPALEARVAEICRAAERASADRPMDLGGKPN